MDLTGIPNYLRSVRLLHQGNLQKPLNRLGLLLQISKHCSDLPPERKIVETDALMHCLAEWAQESSRLSEIIKLPLQEQQEKAS